MYEKYNVQCDFFFKATGHVVHNYPVKRLFILPEIMTFKEKPHCIFSVRQLLNTFMDHNIMLFCPLNLLVRSLIIVHDIFFFYKLHIARTFLYWSNNIATCLSQSLFLFNLLSNMSEGSFTVNEIHNMVLWFERTQGRFTRNVCLRFPLIFIPSRS